MGYVLLIRSGSPSPLESAELAERFALAGASASTVSDQGAVRGLDLELPWDLDEARAADVIAAVLEAARAPGWTAFDPQTGLEVEGPAAALACWKRGRAALLDSKPAPRATPDRAAARLRLGVFAVGLVLIVLVVYLVIGPMLQGIFSALAGE